MVNEGNYLVDREQFNLSRKNEGTRSTSLTIMRPIMLAMSGKSWQAPTGIIGAQLTAQPSDKNAPTYPGTV
jgi:hypothetical protein